MYVSSLARKRRFNFNQIVGYDDEVPTQPTPGAEEKVKTPYLKTKMEALRQVSTLFSEYFIFEM